MTGRRVVARSDEKGLKGGCKMKGELTSMAICVDSSHRLIMNDSRATDSEGLVTNK